MRRLAPTVVFLLLLASCWRIATAQEWTRFRGPNGTGESETQLPARFSPADFNWKVELPGMGHSSPVVWGEKVFLLSADPQDATRYVLCFRASDGAQLWIRRFPSVPHHLHLRSSFASCTPAVDAERVYVAWSTPQETTLMALDHEGRIQWQLDLGPWTSQHGFGTSPILYENMVVLSNSQQANRLEPGQKPGKSYMMAFDRKTGKELWRTPRKSVNVCYSVPCIYRPQNGPEQLVCYSTGNGMFGLEPKTGKELWSIDVFRMRTVNSPIAVNGVIFGSNGSGGGGNYVVAVRPGPGAEVAYRIERQAPYVPTPVARGDLVFLWYDKGTVTCIDASTGNVHWRERVGGNYSCSPVRAGDKIYCIDDNGTLVALAAEKQFQLLGRSALGEATRATPAISGGRMYLRTYSHLICVGGPSS